MKRSSLAVLTAFFILALLASGSLRAQVVTKKVLTLESARKIAALAEAEASRNKWSMVISVVDDGGNLIDLERMDNTQLGSIEVAIQKARTAIFFKRPSKAFEEMIGSGKTDVLGIPGVVPIEGGLPIIVDGQYVGAIGVSGGTRQQDGAVAKAALDAFSSQ